MVNGSNIKMHEVKTPNSYIYNQFTGLNSTEILVSLKQNCISGWILNRTLFCSTNKMKNQ